MAAPASNKSTIGPTEFLIVCALLGGALRYRTLLLQLAWQEVTTRAPVIGLYPRTTAVVVGGVLALILSLVLAVVVLLRGLKGGSRHDLQVVSADRLRAMKGKGEAQPVDGFTARGRLTALTALPKQGKTFAWFGLLKARQQGGEWFGRQVLAGKTCVMTEEDRATFAAKVHRFGITGAALVSIHAPETADARFGREAWAALVDDAARLARRQHCDTLTMDTLTTWAPWAFAGPEAMSYALRTLKQAMGRRHLAGVVILHNRKQQSDLGAVVDMLGTIAGSAAYDVVAGFRREKDTGECTLVVDGRLGEWSCTALLLHGIYIPVESEEQLAEAEHVPDAKRLARHLQQTAGALAAGGEQTTAELVSRLQISKPALLERLRELERLGVVERRGRGVAGDPLRWRTPLGGEDDARQLVDEHRAPRRAAHEEGLPAPPDE